MTPTRLFAVPTALALLTGCGAGGDLTQTAAEERAGAESGADVEVSKDVTIADAELQLPVDGRVQAGDDATLALVVTNTGDRDDELLRLEGGFTGTTGVLPALVPAGGELRTGQDGAAGLVLQHLSAPLAGVATVRVTLVFDRSGTVTVDVPLGG